MMSFGGGLPAWIRREVVQSRGWLDDQQFLSGYALSQLVPGATNVNLAVFIGAQLRGMPARSPRCCGLTALPVAIVLVLGVLYLHSRGCARRRLVQHRAGRHGGGGDRAQPWHRHPPGAPAYQPRGAGTRDRRSSSLSIGVLGFPLLHVLLVMLPVSLVAAWLTRPDDPDRCCNLSLLFAGLSLLAFGGGAGVIPDMQRAAVDLTIG